MTTQTKYIAYQWFLTMSSVLPGIIFAIIANLFPNLRWQSMSKASSTSVHLPCTNFLISLKRWKRSQWVGNIRSRQTLTWRVCHSLPSSTFHDLVQIALKLSFFLFHGEKTWAFLQFARFQNRNHIHGLQLWHYPAALFVPRSNWLTQLELEELELFVALFYTCEVLLSELKSNNVQVDHPS